MRKLILLPCIPLLVAAAPATAAPAAVTNRVAQTDAQQPLTLSGGKSDQAAAEKKICKDLPSSYSRLPNKACLTEKQWKQLDEELER